MDVKPNVDEHELAKFSALAARWWDPHSEFKTLHDINPLRLAYIEQRCGGLVGKTVLDVGCGGGLLSESMAAKGAHVTGIDMSEASLSVAKLHLYESEQQVIYQRISPEDLAEQHPAQFDIVTCLEMLEHVPVPSAVVAACQKLVKPGGQVFFSTINRNPKAYLFAIVGAEYVLRMLPKGTHDYAKFIRPSELERWCQAAGLDWQHIIGMHYNPLSQHYSLAPGVDVNYLVQTQCND